MTMSISIRSCALWLSFAFGAVGCGRTFRTAGPLPSGTAGVRYGAVQQIFDAKCTACHGSTSAARGLRLDSWEQLTRGSAHGEALIAFDAGRSLMVRLTAARAGGAHPGERGAPTLSAAEVERVARWIDEGARSPTGQTPYANPEALLYVCNQDDATVSIIDMDAQLVVRIVDLQALGFSSNAKPHHTAVEPDGSFWYVSLIGEGKVLKFDRRNALVGQAEFDVPGLLALHPTEDLLFVGRSMAAVNPPQRIGVIRRSDMTVEEVDVFLPRPHALAVAPEGRHVYSASLAENRIATVDRRTEELAFTSVSGSPHVLVQFAVSPVDETIVIGGQLSGKFFVFDGRDPQRLVLVNEIDVESAPWHPVYSPDGRFVYVGNKEANAVSFIDMETRTVARVVRGEGLAEPHGAAVSADGRYLFVSNNNLKGTYRPRYRAADREPRGTVVIIDTVTGTIDKVLEVGRYASGVSTRHVR